MHHPNIDCLPLPASLSTLTPLCFTQFSTFPTLLVNQWTESQLPSHLPSKLHPPDCPPPSTVPISLNNGLKVHLQTIIIMASKCIATLARSRPPSVYPDSLDCSMQVCTIMASKSMSKLVRSQPQNVSQFSLNHYLQVYLQTCSITPSKCIFTLAGLQPRRAHNPSLKVHLQTHSITAAEYVSKFTQSRYGKMLELEDSQPTINTLPHLTLASEGNQWERAVLAQGA